MGTTDEFMLDSLSDQVREVLKTSPGLTARGVGQLVPADAPSKISRVLYDLKTSGQVKAVKDAEDGLLHYSLSEPLRADGNGVGRPSTGNGHTRPRRVSHSPLERPIKVLVSAITQRIEDTPTLDMIWAWGDLMVESAKGNGAR